MAPVPFKEYPLCVVYREVGTYTASFELVHSDQAVSEFIESLPLDLDQYEVEVYELLI
jgi:hypothetical protein